jgi:hypothetical protein
LKNKKFESKRYAGAQVGNQCYCGDTLGIPANASDCNQKCVGDPDQICGGGYLKLLFLLHLNINLIGKDDMW